MTTRLRRILKLIDRGLNPLIAKICGGASCPVMGAVFKTVSECARAYLGGFDPHTPPPKRFGIWDLGFGIFVRWNGFRIIQNN